MNLSKDKLLFICGDNFFWNYDAFQIVKNHFENVQLIKADGDKEKIREKIKLLHYDYLISFWNTYFINPNEFMAAKKGAINFHPAPIEHPGLGMYSYVFAFPEKRMHHGTTMHEVNEHLDNGQVYQSTRFSCYGMSPEELALNSVADSLSLLESACSQLKNGINTSELKKKEEDLKWSKQFFTHKQELEWLSKLPKNHIAHQAESYEIVNTLNSKYFSNIKDLFNNLQGL